MANDIGKSFWATYQPKGSLPKTTDDNIIKSLQQFDLSSYQGWAGILSDFFRGIDWWFLKSLAWLADSVAVTGTSLLYFLDFYAYKPVQNFIEQFYVFGILGSLVFFAIAWIAAMSKKEIPVVDMLKSGAFSWFTFVILPILMMVGVGFVTNLSAGISTSTTPSASIIKNNVWDVRAIDKANWNKEEILKLKAAGNGAPNFIETEKNKSGKLAVNWNELEYIDPTEKLTDGGFLGLGEDSGLSGYGKKLIKNKVYYGSVDKDGVVDAKKSSLVKLTKTPIFAENASYYAVSWNGWVIGLSLIVYIVFAIILEIKMVKLETQVFLSWTIGSVVSLTQWGTTKRNWEILSKIGMGFTTLLYTQCLLVFFGFGIMQMTDLLSADNINFLAYILLLFGFGMEMIEGANLWQHLFGIDAGMQSSWRGLGRMGQFMSNILTNKLSGRGRRKSKESSKNEPDENGGKTKENDTGSPEEKPGTKAPDFKSDDLIDKPENKDDNQSDKFKDENVPDKSKQDEDNKSSNNKDTTKPETGEQNEDDELGDFKGGENEKDIVPKPEQREDNKSFSNMDTELNNPFSSSKEVDDYFNSINKNPPEVAEFERGDNKYGL